MVAQVMLSLLPALLAPKARMLLPVPVPLPLPVAKAVRTLEPPPMLALRLPPALPPR